MRRTNIFAWLFLIVFSAMFIVLGIVFIKGSSEEGRLAIEIGFAFIAAGITAVTLNVVVGLVLSHRTTQEIGKTKSDIHSTIKDLENAISIYKGSQQIGLVNLYSDREKAMERIKNLLRNWEAPYYPSEPGSRDAHAVKPIYLIGISLRDFCHLARQPINVGRDETTYGAVEALLMRAKDHNWGSDNPIVRVLVTNPLGYQAMLRMHREEQEGDQRLDFAGAGKLNSEEDCEKRKTAHLFDPDVFQRANLYIEVGRTFRVIETWRRDGLPVDIRGYTASPSCFVVLVPGKSLFVEQYHYGTPRDRVSGGQAPVLEFSPEAAIYSQIEAHSRFIWETSQGQGTNMLLDLLNDIGRCREIWSRQRLCTNAWAGEECNGWSPSPGNTKQMKHVETATDKRSRQKVSPS